MRMRKDSPASRAFWKVIPGGPPMVRWCGPRVVVQTSRNGSQTASLGRKSEGEGESKLPSICCFGLPEFCMTYVWCYCYWNGLRNYHTEVLPCRDTWSHAGQRPHPQGAWLGPPLRSHTQAWTLSVSPSETPAQPQHPGGVPSKHRPVTWAESPPVHWPV